LNAAFLRHFIRFSCGNLPLTTYDDFYNGTIIVEVSMRWQGRRESDNVEDIERCIPPPFHPLFLW
ncbi:hypothetical protein VS893_24655, partial [Shigella flexneri]|uniref:hypothetical protein n=1 Tax=Shigella flexneri TaxID=623 RepID=UPI002EB43418|nr:hypothetical protein [Shigella flexneri]